jgi:hypothetical protein
MSGTRGGLGRIVAGIGLALAVLLLAAAEARAGKYAVAQCGWYVGADASWADTTGGVKFRPSSYCVPPAGADPFDGVHLKSFTRDGQGTVSGTRFARWRWQAPPGTGITQVRGTWWHALHDGIEQRLGVDPGNGGFEAFAAANGTDAVLREFAAGFATPKAAFEDRLLCAKAENKWCSLEAGSWSALRALTITIQDDAVPVAAIGGDIGAGGWRRGVQSAAFSGGDPAGAGIRFGETTVDGGRLDLTEYPCAKALIGSEWRATRMQPCYSSVSGSTAIDTRRFSDGVHYLRHCATDFAGNVGCTPSWPIHIDNNPPASARNLRLAGGEAWRRLNNFDLSWANPDQGPASPIWGAYWRITGPAGYDTGVKLAPGQNVAALPDRSLPRAGLYSLHLWLRDEAGNDAPASAVEVPLRFDDVRPGVAFEAGEGAELPAQVRALVVDAHSGPASGTIFYRRLNAAEWIELQTKLQPRSETDRATLVAQLPELPPGTYVFQVEAEDRAGNAAVTTLRADGTEMAIRKAPPPAPQRAALAPQRSLPPRAKTRLFARLRGGDGAAEALTVPFGAPARLGGRLVRADGAGLAGRELRVIARPSRGAVASVETLSVLTGEHGGFELELEPGPSRQVSAFFTGDRGLEPAGRPSLDLRVRSGVTLAAKPLSLSTGEMVRLRGRVRTRGAAVPRRGKLIAIQYLEAASGRWRPVLVTRSDRSGRFRARYRFRYVSGTARVRLRATALAEERWPYAPGSSRPLTVQVHGR